MSRRKQAERYKILYTPYIKLMGARWSLDPSIHVYKWNVAMVVGPPINDYTTLAGFDDLAEAKAYRRKKINEERVK